jgi:hypothetical protein
MFYFYVYSFFHIPPSPQGRMTYFAAFPAVATDSGQVLFVEVMSFEDPDGKGFRNGCFTIPFNIWLPDDCSKQLSILNACAYIESVRGTEEREWKVTGCFKNNVEVRLPKSLSGTSLGLAWIVSAFWQIPYTKAVFTGYVRVVGNMNDPDPPVKHIDLFDVKYAECFRQNVVLVGNQPDHVILLDDSLCMDVKLMSDVILACNTLTECISCVEAVALYRRKKKVNEEKLKFLTH